MWLDYCKTFKNKIITEYTKFLNKRINIENPILFTEKVQWLKIYDSSFLKTFCTDKITVHDYVKEKIGKDICVPILKIYDKPEEIKLDELPNQFVIKCNHACQMNIIVKDKNNFNLSLAKQTLNKWLKEDYSQNIGYELHYKNIPHRILVEEYKENQGHSDLIDYKFYCFNGNPIFCQVITDRHSGEKISHYDMDWNYRPEYDWINFSSVSNLQKPKHYSKMIEYAKILSKDFKLVRVDFYEIDDKIYLGELTFTPMAGYIKYKNPNTNLQLGNLLKL